MFVVARHRRREGGALRFIGLNLVTFRAILSYPAQLVKPFALLDDDKFRRKKTRLARTRPRDHSVARAAQLRLQLIRVRKVKAPHRLHDNSLSVNVRQVKVGDCNAIGESIQNKCGL